jgi:hypothetical protein
MAIEKYSDLDLQPGDRVRVQIDCEMTVVGPGLFLYADLDVKRDFAYDLECLSVTDASVTKVERKLEPGDLVRSRATGEYFLLGRTGYMPFVCGEKGSAYNEDLETTFPLQQYDRMVAP